MNPAEVDPILHSLLADRRVSASEKKTLLDRFAAERVDEQGLAFVRHRAFALARDAVAEAETKQLFEWLEDVIKLTLKPSVHEKPSAEQSPAQAFFSPGSDCVHAVIRQFQQARFRVDVCVFTITDDRIADAVVTAHRRGVKIRIISDDLKSQDVGSDIERFEGEGISCAIDDSPAHMHHKFALFDRCRLLTGSFNWTRCATNNNEENIIITPDTALIVPFEQRFEQLWARWAKG